MRRKSSSGYPVTWKYVYFRTKVRKYFRTFESTKVFSKVGLRKYSTVSSYESIIRKYFRTVHVLYVYSCTVHCVSRTTCTTHRIGIVSPFARLPDSTSSYRSRRRAFGRRTEVTWMRRESFFGLEVAPGEPAYYRPDEYCPRVDLTRATLVLTGDAAALDGTRVLVKARVARGALARFPVAIDPRPQRPPRC